MLDIIRNDDYEVITNGIFVDKNSDDREKLELDALRITEILCCPCILTKYSHKFAVMPQLS